MGENFNSNFTQGNKIISGKKTEVYDFFPMKHILQKFSNTFYERCEDPQIFIVINCKHVAKIGRKNLDYNFIFQKTCQMATPKHWKCWICTH